MISAIPANGVEGILPLRFQSANTTALDERLRVLVLMPPGRAQENKRKKGPEIPQRGIHWADPGKNPFCRVESGIFISKIDFCGL